MTKTLILIALVVLIYLYWKSQQKTTPYNPDDIIERKGKAPEHFWDANDWEINSDNDNFKYD